MNNRIFDTILFEENDVVIRKAKSPDLSGNPPKEERICKTVQVDSGTGYVYQIIYFHSNPTSPFVAYEFEPFDAKQKEEYYAILKANSISNKPKDKKMIKSKQQSEALSIKNFKDIKR